MEKKKTSEQFEPLSEQSLSQVLRKVIDGSLEKKELFGWQHTSQKTTKGFDVIDSTPQQQGPSKEGPKGPGMG